MKYTVEMTDEQARVIFVALEEYFRLRMGQVWDFCNDMSEINADLNPENPGHDKIFQDSITRRDHLEEVMRCFFRIAYEPRGYLEQKTEDMLTAEDLWDAFRFARNPDIVKTRGYPLHVGAEPPVKIERVAE